MEIILAIMVIALLLLVGVATAADRAVPARHHRGPTVAEIRARLERESPRAAFTVGGRW
ncbi:MULTISPECIES: hypothetical protein [unclassified Nocardia]|uniref:hypothetical protein n=1 Tax=unclassified Nocardia TaxID=2637762 RepID=UPI00278C8C02|nr:MULTISPECIES: hypothetical protein [unclassified Nocardia]